MQGMGIVGMLGIYSMVICKLNCQQYASQMTEHVIPQEIKSVPVIISQI